MADDYRCLGVLGALAGFGMIVAAAASRGWSEELPGSALGAAVTTVGMYLALLRPAGKRIAAEAEPPTSGYRLESSSRTWSRASRTTVAVVAVTGVLGELVGDVAVAGAVVAGNGGALLLAGRWFGRWERAHERRLLRKPGRKLDPRDFYAVDASL